RQNTALYDAGSGLNDIDLWVGAALYAADIRPDVRHLIGRKVIKEANVGKPSSFSNQPFGDTKASKSLRTGLPLIRLWGVAAPTELDREGARRALARDSILPKQSRSIRQRAIRLDHFANWKPPFVRQLDLVILACPSAALLLLEVKLAILQHFPLLRVPEYVVRDPSQLLIRLPSRFREGDQSAELLASKHLIEQAANKMEVVIPYLDEDAPALCQQLARNDQAIPKIGQVGVDAQLPRVPERLHLLRLPGHVHRAAVLHVALPGGDLPVGAELDPVGRVHVDHLDLALQPFFLRQRVHDQQRVAQDQPVGPVLLVAVELHQLFPRDAIEVPEEVHL